jgi:hypothetical protein
VLLSVRVELVHDLAFATVSVLVAAHWWFANSDMQNDLIFALRAFPDVISFRCWFEDH